MPGTQQARRASQRRFTTVVSALLTFLLIAATALVGAVVVVPKVVGGMSLTVLSGSMEPGIMPGDIVVTRGVDTASAAQLKIGDVITFLPYPDDPTLVTHRIVSKSVSASGTSFVTKGDNNNTVDPWGPVRDFQVRGVVLYAVPAIGWVRQWLGNQVQLIIVVIGVGLIAYGGVSFATSWRRQRGGRPDQSSARRALQGA